MWVLLLKKKGKGKKGGYSFEHLKVKAMVLVPESIVSDTFVFSWVTFFGDVNVGAQLR